MWHPRCAYPRHNPMICAADHQHTLPVASSLHISPPDHHDMCTRPPMHALCGIFTAHIPDLSPATLRVHPSLHPKGPRNSLGPGALARNEERLTDRQMTIIRQILVASIQEVFLDAVRPVIAGNGNFHSEAIVSRIHVMVPIRKASAAIRTSGHMPAA